MLEISGEHALVEIPEGVDTRPSGTIALLLGEFMSIPMQIEDRNGDELLLSYKNKPHPSVQTLASGKVLAASIGSAVPMVKKAESSVDGNDPTSWPRSRLRAKCPADRSRIATGLLNPD
ncbi:hypothetical protein [uncultured Erythrobacter sp.]|uniref:hypothetical protein n=1 Tax=uncultured Erythrobacter sp. TaxID=263913 RepID=UPI0026117419|nr:hypothetical protein [uncultured Erythrobacter sp.]